MTRVNGYCPACGADWLVVSGVGVGDLLCADPECPARDSLALLLAKPDQHRHLIDFREDGIAVQHPLLERLDAHALATGEGCSIHADLVALTGPPGIGLYAVEPGQRLADAFDVQRDEVLFEVESIPASPEVVDAQRVRDQWSMIPFGAIVGVPEETAIPEDEDRFIWVLGQKIKRADYPDLAALWEREGIHFDGEDETYLQLPTLSPTEGMQQAVIRAKP